MIGTGGPVRAHACLHRRQHDDSETQCAITQSAAMEKSVNSGQKENALKNTREKTLLAGACLHRAENGPFQKIEVDSGLQSLAFLDEVLVNMPVGGKHARF